MPLTIPTNLFQVPFFKRIVNSTVFKPALAEYQRTLSNPMIVQEDLLQKIIRQNKNTVYGRKYHFSAIKNVKDFQNILPIVTYEDLHPFIDRMLKGQKNVLTKQKVIFFATTSGSTNKPKLIPVTKQRINQLYKELTLWAVFILGKNFRSVVKGKTLYFAGPYREDISEGGTLMGSISGYMAYKSPRWTRPKMVVPYEYYNEMDFDKKTHMIAKKALQADISQLAFASPIEALLFFEYVEKNFDALIRDLLVDGKLRHAKRLAKLPDAKPKTIWPHISLINTVMAESNLPHLKVLQTMLALPKESVRDPGIYASEGRLTIGLTDYVNAGVIMAQENFFEFMPELADEVYGPPITIDKIKKGKNYKILITTTEGLYRYDMGDVLKVIDFKKNLPIVRFVKRDSFLNIVGEFSPENQLISAADKMLKQYAIDAVAYTYVPYLKDLKKRPSYEFLLETKDDLTDEKYADFIKDLDKELKSRIQDYRQMREEFGRLGHIRLSLVKKGDFTAFEKTRFERSGQPKPIRVAKKESFRDNFTVVKGFVVE